MDLTKGDMLIFSGEGEAGTIERYEGARTAKAIRARLSRERVKGDRWASAWIEAPELDDGSGRTAYVKLGTDLEPTSELRAIDPAAIRVNPAAALAAAKRGRSPASAINGARGGRPTKKAGA